MKRIFCLIFIFIILCGCADKSPPKVYTDAPFSLDKNRNIIDDNGTVYSFLATEADLCCLGELEFLGGINGEEVVSQHLGLEFQTGMYSLKNDETKDVLVRQFPDNEWCSIYRKSEKPKFDFSLYNCTRLEFVKGNGDLAEDGIHATCGDGITNKSEISAFFSEVKKQKSPAEAGLYDKIANSDGTLSNCTVIGVIYAFFEGEPNLAKSMRVTSYNHIAYSVSIDENEYVLPETLINNLKSKDLH